MTQPVDNPAELDATGYRCPMPVIRMEAALRDLSPGNCLKIRADDPLAAIDIPHFCHEAGHTVVQLTDEGTKDRPVSVFMVTRGPNSL
ncbi:sulfurtransferase TusA family protein [Hyphococcus lacteus]|uniref:Sulfurtransferase TusA family protein n=1 Tax=Hyphococcus lacteus TaxID=3143536 RepID=A0ABV3Z1X3_9PROT